MVKNEHYIPKFYLERFSKNEKIYVYDLINDKIFPTNIRKVGSKNYFYDLDPKILKEILAEYKELTDISKEQYEELTNDVQFVENALSRLEAKAGFYFNKFEEDYSLINDDGFLSILFLFMRTLSIRTMSFRAGLENIAEQTTDWLNSLNIKEVSNYPLDMAPKDIAKINQLQELTSLARTYDKSMKFFNNYNIYIGVNETDMDFLISDNPLVYFWLGFNDICFPINPKLSIIMQVKNVKKEFKICDFKPNENGVIKLSEKEVIKYNILQHNTNARYLFGSEHMLKCHKEIIKLLNMINRIRKKEFRIE